MNTKIIMEFKKLLRNSEYSKSDDFKNLKVLAQTVKFSDKNYV